MVNQRRAGLGENRHYPPGRDIYADIAVHPFL
jgi:hypothetical protein